MTLGLTRGLSRNLSLQGRYDEATNISLEVVRLRNDVRSRSELANNFMLQGQYTKAQGLYLTMLDQEGMVREMDQVDVGHDLLKLAETYSKTGNYARAEHYQFLALAAMEKKWGASHRWTINVVVELAETYYHLDRLDKAEELQLIAIEHEEEQKGRSHRSTLVTMKHLSNIWLAQGKRSEAQEVASETLSLTLEPFGAESPEHLRRKGWYDKNFGTDLDPMDLHVRLALLVGTKPDF